MNTQSNTYTFLYASILVVLVAAVLSFTALQLKPRQAKNKEIEKKQDILKAVNIASTPENAEELYNQYIVKAIIVNSEGNVTSEDKNATFNVNLKIENSKKNVAERKLPIFTFNKEGLGEKMIIPIRGRGMWGPIWGYISMEQDGKTIYGATFGNQGETPGLGAEISKSEFQKPFTGKEIFDENGKFTSLTLVKGTAQGHPHQFDAVSGGTVTSKGLEAMLQDNLSSYEKFLKSSK